MTVLGLTFKEDCPDLRNSKAIDIIRELEDYEINVQVHDPIADPKEAEYEYGINLTPMEELKPAAAVVAAVAHKAYREMSVIQLTGLMNSKPALIDVKGIYDKQSLKNTRMRVWRL